MLVASVRSAALFVKLVPAVACAQHTSRVNWNHIWVHEAWISCFGEGSVQRLLRCYLRRLGGAAANAQVDDPRETCFPT